MLFFCLLCCVWWLRSIFRLIIQVVIFSTPAPLASCIWVVITWNCAIVGSQLSRSCSSSKAWIKATGFPLLGSPSWVFPTRDDIMGWMQPCRVWHSTALTTRPLWCLLLVPVNVKLTLFELFIEFNTALSEECKRLYTIIFQSQWPEPLKRCE